MKTNRDIKLIKIRNLILTDCLCFESDCVLRTMNPQLSQRRKNSSSLFTVPGTALQLDLCRLTPLAVPWPRNKMSKMWQDFIHLFSLPMKPQPSQKWTSILILIPNSELAVEFAVAFLFFPPPAVRTSLWRAPNSGTEALVQCTSLWWVTICASRSVSGSSGSSSSSSNDGGPPPSSTWVLLKKFSFASVAACVPNPSDWDAVPSGVSSSQHCLNKNRF